MTYSGRIPKVPKRLVSVGGIIVVLPGESNMSQSSISFTLVLYSVKFLNRECYYFEQGLFIVSGTFN